MALSPEELELGKKWKAQGFSREQIADGISRLRQPETTGQHLKDFGVGAALSVPKTIVGQGLTNFTLTPFKAVQQYVVDPIVESKWMQNMDWVKNRERLRSTDIAQRDANIMTKETESRGTDAMLGDIAGQVGTAIASGNAARGLAGVAGLAPTLAPKVMPWIARKGVAAGENVAEYMALDTPHDTSEDYKGGALGLTLAGILGFALGGRKGAIAAEELSEGAKKILRNIATSPAAEKEEAEFADSILRGKFGPGDFEKKLKETTVVDGKVVPTKSAMVLNTLMNNPKRLTKFKNTVRTDLSGDPKQSSLSQMYTRWFRRSDPALRKMGAEGAALADTFKKADSEKFQFSQLGLNQIEALEKQIGKLDENFMELYENRLFDKMTPKQLKQAELFKQATEFYKREGNALAGKEIIRTLPDKEYVPHITRPEVRDDIIDGKNTEQFIQDLMDQNGISRMEAADWYQRIRESQLSRFQGDVNEVFFQKHRSGIIPKKWLVQDPMKALKAYNDVWANRVAAERNWGGSGELLFKKFGAVSEAAKKELFSKNPKVQLGMVNELFNQYLSRVPTAKWVRNVKAFETLKMATSAVSNVADLVPTAMQDGFFRTMKNTLKYAMLPSSRRLAQQSGGGLDDAMKAASNLDDRHKFSNILLSAVGFKMTQRWADGVVALNAVDKLKGLKKAYAKNPDNALLISKIQDLFGGEEKFIKQFIESSDPKDMEFLGSIAGVTSMQKLRPIDFLDVPTAWNSNAPGPALMLQFKRFSVNLSKVVYRETIGNFKKGNVKDGTLALGRLIAAGYITGALRTEGKQSINNMIAGLGNVMAGNGWETPQQEEEFKTFTETVIDNLMAAGGLGLPTELFTMGKYGSDYDLGATAFMGPFVGDLTKLGYGAISLVSDAFDEERRNKIMASDESMETYKQQKMKTLLSVIPVVNTGYKAALETEKQFESGDAYYEQSQSKNRPSFFQKAIALFKGILPRPESGDGQIIVESAQQIKDQVAGINDAQTFQILAGSDPSKVEITGEGAENASQFLTRGYGRWLKVTKIRDGDTLEFADGSAVRLLGVDTPETAKPWRWQDPFTIKTNEPGAQEAKTFLSELAPVGSDVYVAGDKVSGQKDIFGERDLGYLYNKQGVDVNKEILTKGYGRGMFEYPFERAPEFMDANKQTQAGPDIPAGYPTPDPNWTAAKRNNNPGNIKYSKAFMETLQNYGIQAERASAATDGGNFLRFQNHKDGLRALVILLTKTSTYPEMSVNDAMYRWSGKGYDASVAIGIDGTKKIKELSKDELAALMKGMTTREGWGYQQGLGPSMSAPPQAPAQYTQPPQEESSGIGGKLLAGAAGLGLLAIGGKKLAGKMAKEVPMEEVTRMKEGLRTKAMKTEEGRIDLGLDALSKRMDKAPAAAPTRTATEAPTRAMTEEEFNNMDDGLGRAPVAEPVKKPKWEPTARRPLKEFAKPIKEEIRWGGAVDDSYKKMRKWREKQEKAGSINPSYAPKHTPGSLQMSGVNESSAKSLYIALKKKMAGLYGDSFATLNEAEKKEATKLAMEKQYETLSTFWTGRREAATLAGDKTKSEPLNAYYEAQQVLRDIEEAYKGPKLSEWRDQVKNFELKRLSRGEYEDEINRMAADFVRRGVQPEGIKVVMKDGLMDAKSGREVSAQVNTKTGEVFINEARLKEDFKNKEWTNPKELVEVVDGVEHRSKALALPPDAFKTYEEMKAFVLAHEFAHTIFKRSKY